MKPLSCSLALLFLIISCSPEVHENESAAANEIESNPDTLIENTEVRATDAPEDFDAIAPDDWALISSRGANARFAVIIKDSASNKVTGAYGYIALDGSSDYLLRPSLYRLSNEKAAKAKFQRETESFPVVAGYSVYATGKKRGYDAVLQMPLLSASYVNRELDIFCSMNRPGAAHCIWGHENALYKLSFDSLRTETVLPYVLSKAKEHN